MRHSIVLLFIFSTLAFVAVYAAFQEEADVPSLSVNEDSDERSGQGARVKRAQNGPPKPPPGAKSPKGKMKGPGTAPPGGKPLKPAGGLPGRPSVYSGRPWRYPSHRPYGGYCSCYSWDYGPCYWTWYGCYCKGNRGCLVYVRDYGGRWRSCKVEGDSSSVCQCWHYWDRKVQCCSPPKLVRWPGGVGGPPFSSRPRHDATV
ncbi:hypothetical protein LSAT2_013106 [Lamellibrachia satsuma]|nr:hypothetical protein LSAT2_013106 [Lamellibrachia satsuma]